MHVVLYTYFVNYVLSAQTTQEGHTYLSVCMFRPWQTSYWILIKLECHLKLSVLLKLKLFEVGLGNEIGSGGVGPQCFYYICIFMLETHAIMPKYWHQPLRSKWKDHRLSRLLLWRRSRCSRWTCRWCSFKLVATPTYT
jgi:hypothetical protein